jgi:2-polyprenyl-6-methoxyphenol hydroxylase-like FAD-dependent oxidoreductase
MDIDALVVGAGPVGLTMAAELARHGVRCRIIDKAPQRTDKSKALVLWPRTLELLGNAGALEPFLQAGRKVVHARLFSNGRPLAALRFDGVPSPHAFALMIPQSDTEKLLDDHLQSRGIHTERGVELSGFRMTSDGVMAQLRHSTGAQETLQAAWLLGCDGAHSTVRHILGKDFAGVAEPNDWLLADVRLQGGIAPDEVRLELHSDGVLALFPIGVDRFRIIADAGAAQGERPPDPSLADVQRVLDQRGPGGIVAHDPLWLAGFRINERKVADYRSGRVFLAGDAAHIHSPAGGQGMNTGMQDAVNLSWKLALVHAGRARERLLDSYTTERSAVGEMVLRNAGAVTRLGTLRHPLAQRVRNTLVPLVTSLHAVRTALANTLTEMAINYRRGPLSRDDRPALEYARALFGGTVAGDRAPDTPLSDAPGETATPLFAQLRAGRHSLLLSCGGDAALRATLQSVAAEVAAPFGHSVDSFVVDRLAAAYGARSPAAVLVRPDGYIGYYGQPVERGRLFAYLASYLVPV